MRGVKAVLVLGYSVRVTMAKRNVVKLTHPVFPKVPLELIDLPPLNL